jgi:urease beta subunit
MGGLRRSAGATAALKAAEARSHGRRPLRVRVRIAGGNAVRPTPGINQSLALVLAATHAQGARELQSVESRPSLRL